MSSEYSGDRSDVFVALEVAAVTSQLSILDETMYELRKSNRMLGAASFERAKMELLTDPEAYFTKSAEIARDTWQHQPVIAKYMYTDDSNED